MSDEKSLAKGDLMPLFPLHAVLFPGMFLPLVIFEDRYRLLLQRCLEEEKAFGVALIQSGSETGPPAFPHKVGVTARILRLDHLEDGRIRILTQGEDRFVLRELSEDQPYLQAVTDTLADADEADEALPALARETGALFKEYISVLLAIADRWIGEFEMPSAPGAMSFFVAARLNIPLSLKQRLLEMTSIRARMTEEREMMSREIAQMELLAKRRIPKSDAPLA